MKKLPDTFLRSSGYEQNFLYDWANWVKCLFILPFPPSAKGLAMPKHDQTAEQIEAETDALLLAQAKVFIHDLRATT